ncbi:hypothetical protein D3C72_1429580 [compost metagenome]
MRQVKPAVLHRVRLADLVHQRRRVVARHADTLGSRGYSRDQLRPLVYGRVVRRRGVHMRDEHHLVPAQQFDELAHFLLDLLVRLIALDDAGEQVTVVRVQALEDRILVQQRAALGKPFGVGHGPELARTRPVGEELAEVADQVVRLDRIAVDGQELARRQLDHVQVGRLVRAAARLLAIRRPEDQSLDVSRNVGLVEHESRLLKRFGGRVHETVVSAELQFDRVASHGIAQRRMDAAGSYRSDGKSSHSGSLLQ